MDAMTTIDKLGRNINLQLLPGVKVISDSMVLASDPAESNQVTPLTDDNVDEMLMQKLSNFGRSLSLSVQLFDKKSQKKEGNTLDTQSVGRAEKKGKWSGTLVTAAVLTGGTLLWMGVSSLMAMATKALAASLLSIIISIFTAYKSSGSTHKSTTYEIVAKPVYSHPYSSGEIQHDPHASASAAAPSHQYGRNLEWSATGDKVGSMSSRSEVQIPPLMPIRDDAHLGYRTHVRPIYKRNVITANNLY